MEVLCESKAVDLKHLFKYLLFFLIMEDSNFFYKICVKTLRYTRLELRQNIFSMTCHNTQHSYGIIKTKQAIQYRSEEVPLQQIT